MSAIDIISPGPLSTIQDLGRPGYAHLGVPRSGAANRDSMGLANRLVGNTEYAAVIESTMGGLSLRASAPVVVAVTGALATVRVDGTPVGLGAALPLRAGAELSIAIPTSGCRTYLAVRGGFDVPRTLGSRSTDTLSGLGPAPLSAGQRLTIGNEKGPWPAVTQAPIDAQHSLDLDVSPGPRADRLARVDDLAVGEWEVSGHSDRVGVRLLRSDPREPLLHHLDDADELASEGIAHGSVQIPPSGEPVLFLADHPVTGGYPVVAVLTAASLSRAAQLVAGDRVRFRFR